MTKPVNIYFGTGSSDLDPNARQVLDQVALTAVRVETGELTSFTYAQLARMAEELQLDGAVQYADPVKRVFTFAAPNDLDRPRTTMPIARVKDDRARASGKVGENAGKRQLPAHAKRKHASDQSQNRRNPSLKAGPSIPNPLLKHRHFHGGNNQHDDCRDFSNLLDQKAGLREPIFQRGWERGISQTSPQ